MKKVIKLLLCCSLFNLTSASHSPSDNAWHASIAKLNSQNQKIIDAHPAGKVYSLHTHHMNQESKEHITTTNFIYQLVDNQRNCLMGQSNYELITQSHPDNLRKIGKITAIHIVDPVISEQEAQSMCRLLISCTKKHLQILKCQEIQGTIEPDYEQLEIPVVWDPKKVDEQKKDE